MDPLIDSLLSRGLVSRTSVGGRGRAAGITITAAGIELLLRVRPAVAELNAPGRIGVPENELPLLIAQLRAMRAHLAAPDCAAGR
ncbi:MAG: hypothetical protein IPK37_07505 [Austwickia sp.]|nr:MAG: hypothetical protein IPK37_07505 [Austwickia sp.]